MADETRPDIGDRLSKTHRYETSLSSTVSIWSILSSWSYVMPTPTSFGSKRRTAHHSGRSNVAKRAAAAANKKRANNAAAAAAKKELNNYDIFLRAMSFVTPYRKKLERNQAFNNTVANIRRGNMNIMYGGQHRMRPLGLTQQQWYALAGVLNTIQRHPNHVRTNLRPIRNSFHTSGRYTNANRNALIAWARSV
jgi:hypothetical protein